MSVYIFTYMKRYESLLENSIRFSLCPSMENIFNGRWKCLIKMECMNQEYTEKVSIREDYKYKI